jgi:DNA-binding NarL/FixJ family response regulator
MNAVAVRPVKIYLAEDSAPIRERVAAMLEARDMSVVGEGATPQRCVDGILATRPDVVVLDAQLEGGSGLEVLQSVRRTEPRIAFVVFSNNAGPAYRRRYLAEGARDFLDKTADFERLADAVADAAPSFVH